MGIVKGPYDAADWLTMKMLKKSVSDMIERKKERYALVIKNETKHLKRYLDREAA